MTTSADVIVSYDGTPNDDDALVLGHALTARRAGLALAYVRHSRELDPRREALAQHDAERRLRSGVDLVGDDSIATHVIFSGSTGGGLEQLAAAEGARLVVFGSDYRTAPGRAEPGNTAQRLLDGGTLAVAVACAGLRLGLEAAIGTVAGFNPDDDPAVATTVERLAGSLGAEMLPAGTQSADLLVVGSRPGVRAGHIGLSGGARSALSSARGSVLVLARDRALVL